MKMGFGRRVLILQVVFLFACGGKGSPGDTSHLSGDVSDAGDIVDAGDAVDNLADIGDAMDVPDDAGPLDSAMDQVSETQCPTTQPLSDYFLFEVTGLPQVGPSVSGVFGEAVVTRKGYFHSGSKRGSEIVFSRSDGKGNVVVQSTLPLGYEIPVALGQRVYLFVRREPNFSGRNLVLVVWDVPPGGQTGSPIFFLHDAALTGDPAWYDCDKKKPCPSVRQVPTDCPPVLAECGKAVHPPVELMAYGGLSSGEAPQILDRGKVTTGFQGYKYMVIDASHYTENVCMDYPGDWTSALIGKSVYASQCVCHDNGDCDAYEFCDTTTNRCLADLCRKEALDAAGKKCGKGWVCNPYRGGCFNPAKDPTGTCSTDADCPTNAVCNPGMRLCAGPNDCTQPVSRCVDNPCVKMKCTTKCHPLLGACAGCLRDCDCALGGTGNWCKADRTCGQCDMGKLRFGRENPEKYEFYEMCVKKDSVNLLPRLKAVDPSVTCAKVTKSPFIDCDDATEVRCHGDLSYVPGGKRLSGACFDRLCALSNLQVVTRIAGGHFL